MTRSTKPPRGAGTQPPESQEQRDGGGGDWPEPTVGYYPLLEENYAEKLSVCDRIRAKSVAKQM
jgi:hypothetical protein